MGRRYCLRHDLATTPPAAGQARLSGGAAMTATLMRKVATLLRAHFAPSLGAAVVVLLAAALLVADARVAALGLAGLLLAVTAAVLSRYREIYRRNGTDTNSRMAEIGMTLHELIALRIENGLYAVPPGQSTESYIEERIKAIHAARNQVLRTGDGRWFAIDLSPAPDGGWVTLWTDITQIKRAEEERRLLEIQLHNAQKLEAMGTLAGGMAHDLNNAMVPLLALTKLAAQALPEGSRERRRLELVQRGAERAREVAAQMLAFSREEKLETCAIDFPAVLREAMELLRASLPATIRLETRISSVPPIVANAGQLNQVIVNLVTNASQAIGAEMGVIDVSLEPATAPDAATGGKGGVWVRLAIADSGCGMDDATRRRIFEPFFTTKDVGQGAGLGLSVVHGIVAAHGGTIEVSSRPGDGTRFDILLPAA